jgi:hypothetical protein
MVRVVEAVLAVVMVVSAVVVMMVGTVGMCVDQVSESWFMQHPHTVRVL